MDRLRDSHQQIERRTKDGKRPMVSDGDAELLGLSLAKKRHCSNAGQQMMGAHLPPNPSMNNMQAHYDQLNMMSSPFPMHPGHQNGSSGPLMPGHHRGLPSQPANPHQQPKLPRLADQARTTSQPRPPSDPMLFGPYQPGYRQTSGNPNQKENFINNQMTGQHEMYSGGPLGTSLPRDLPELGMQGNLQNSNHPVPNGAGQNIPGHLAPPPPFGVNARYRLGKPAAPMGHPGHPYGPGHPDLRFEGNRFPAQMNAFFPPPFVPPGVVGYPPYGHPRMPYHHSNGHMLMGQNLASQRPQGSPAFPFSLNQGLPEGYQRKPPHADDRQSPESSRQSASEEGQHAFPSPYSRQSASEGRTDSSGQSASEERRGTWPRPSPDSRQNSSNLRATAPEFVPSTSGPGFTVPNLNPLASLPMPFVPDPRLMASGMVPMVPLGMPLAPRLGAMAPNCMPPVPGLTPMVSGLTHSPSEPGHPGHESKSPPARGDLSPASNGLENIRNPTRRAHFEDLMNKGFPSSQGQQDGFHPPDKTNEVVSFQNGGASIQNRESPIQNGGASIQNRGSPIQNGGASIQNRGSPIQNGGASIQNRGSSIQNYGASIQNKGSPIQNGGASIQNGGPPIQNGRTLNQNGVASNLNNMALKLNGGASIPNERTSHLNCEATNQNGMASLPNSINSSRTSWASNDKNYTSIKSDGVMHINVVNTNEIGRTSNDNSRFANQNGSASNKNVQQSSIVPGVAKENLITDNLHPSNRSYCNDSLAEIKGLFKTSMEKATSRLCAKKRPNIMQNGKDDSIMPEKMPKKDMPKTLPTYEGPNSDFAQCYQSSKAGNKFDEPCSKTMTFNQENGCSNSSQSSTYTQMQKVATSNRKQMSPFPESLESRRNPMGPVNGSDSPDYGPEITGSSADSGPEMTANSANNGPWMSTDITDDELEMIANSADIEAEDSLDFDLLFKCKPFECNLEQQKMFVDYLKESSYRVKRKLIGYDLNSMSVGEIKDKMTDYFVITILEEEQKLLNIMEKSAK